MKTDPNRLGTPFVTLLTSPQGGGILGALTNYINGNVSPLYFQNVMHWNGVSDVPGAAIGQGIFEGLICGLIFRSRWNTCKGRSELMADPPAKPLHSSDK